MQLAILVPKPETIYINSFIPGSAIVAKADDLKLEQALIYFEGNAYGIRELKGFAQRLACAADRLAQGYPNIARGAFPPKEFFDVGRYDADRFVTLSINDPDVLHRWCGETAEDIKGPTYPNGFLAWEKAIKLVHDNAQPIAQQASHPDVMFYKSKAGQIIRFDMKAKSASVYNYDEPKIRAELIDRLDERGRKIVFGLTDKSA